MSKDVESGHKTLSVGRKIQGILTFGLRGDDSHWVVGRTIGRENGQTGPGQSRQE